MIVTNLAAFYDFAENRLQRFQNLYRTDWFSLIYKCGRENIQTVLTTAQLYITVELQIFAVKNFVITLGKITWILIFAIINFVIMYGKPTSIAELLTILNFREKNIFVIACLITRNSWKYCARKIWSYTVIVPVASSLVHKNVHTY